MVDVGGLHTVEAPPDRTHPRPSSKHKGDISLPHRIKGQAIRDRRWAGVDTRLKSKGCLPWGTKDCIRIERRRGPWVNDSL